VWVVDGFENALRMAWEVWWALALGFTLSGIVQAWVPRARIQRALGRRRTRDVGLATALGAASSSCSYAAIAIARSLFVQGASLVAAMAFQFASTNLVFELGIVLWLLLGWQFTLAQLVGGVLLIVLLWAALTAFVSRRREEDVRVHATAAAPGHQHLSAATELPLRQRLVSLQSWSDVAHNVRGDVEMLWKEIVAGFLIAGYVALLPQGFFNALLLTNGPAPLRLLENVVVGPLIAALAFVCSVGNVPLAAVLWAGGSSFAGVLAFLFADLLIVPIVAFYRKTYGGRFAVFLTATMFVAAAVAALVTDGLFSLAGLVPSVRPSVDSIVDRPVTWNYTSILDLLLAAVLAALVALTLRRGARDPVCGMTVDRHASPATAAHAGTTFFFCSSHCRHTFERDPEAYA
jgi:hypothetical protein